MSPRQLAFIEVQQLHAEIAQVLDAGHFKRWPEFFTEQGRYVVQSRENHQRGWPLALMRLESRAMLRGSGTGATETITHDPYAQRHLVGAPVLLEVSDTAMRSEASYLVMRTHVDRLPEVLSLGRYLDRLVRDGDRWLIEERLVIYDNDLIANSLIYPI